MGYYDDHARVNEVTKKRGKAGYFISGLSGVLIGAMLVWFLFPSLGNEIQQTTTKTENNSSTQVVTNVTTDVTKAVEIAKDAVVGITNLQQSSGFFGNAGSGIAEAGSGSGVIYKKTNGKAYVITNNHVVEGADEIEVTLSDGEKIQAKVLGTDVWTDLAVLEMDASKVKQVVTFGKSEALKQGETVIAIGNPLGLDFSGSVTTGVVSGKDRAIPVDLNNDGQTDWQAEVLQTDAAINPGNSGGALVNLAGHLIGINSMKIAESAVEGIGLAIPIDSAIPIIEDLEKYGEVKRPTMGVMLIDVTAVSAAAQQEILKLPDSVATGVVVEEVVDGSPANKAGMKKYDVIVEMDGQKIEDTIQLRKHLYNEKEIGDSLKVKVYRQGKLVELNITLTDAVTM